METSWILYIVVKRSIYYLKNMNNLEVAKLAAGIERGHVLNIKGLGMLKVFNIFNDVSRDGNKSFEEIGLYCERVDA